MARLKLSILRFGFGCCKYLIKPRNKFKFFGSLAKLWNRLPLCRQQRRCGFLHCSTKLGFSNRTIYGSSMCSTKSKLHKSSCMHLSHTLFFGKISLLQFVHVVPGVSRIHTCNMAILFFEPGNAQQTSKMFHSAVLFTRHIRLPVPKD